MHGWAYWCALTSCLFRYFGSMTVLSVGGRKLFSLRASKAVSWDAISCLISADYRRTAKQGTTCYVASHILHTHTRTCTWQSHTAHTTTHTHMQCTYPQGGIKLAMLLQSLPSLSSSTQPWDKETVRFPSQPLLHLPPSLPSPFTAPPSLPLSLYCTSLPRSPLPSLHLPRSPSPFTAPPPLPLSLYCTSLPRSPLPSLHLPRSLPSPFTASPSLAPLSLHCTSLAPLSLHCTSLPRSPLPSLHLPRSLPSPFTAPPPLPSPFTAPPSLAPLFLHCISLARSPLPSLHLPPSLPSPFTAPLSLPSLFTAPPPLLPLPSLHHPLSPSPFLPLQAYLSWPRR